MKKTLEELIDIAVDANKAVKRRQVEHMWRTPKSAPRQTSQAALRERMQAIVEALQEALEERPVHTNRVVMGSDFGKERGLTVAAIDPARKPAHTLVVMSTPYHDSDWLKDYLIDDPKACPKKTWISKATEVQAWWEAVTPRRGVFKQNVHDEVIVATEPQVPIGGTPGKLSQKIMAISSDKNSPLYIADCASWEVFLDGIKQFDCVTANAEFGWVEVTKRDKDGKPLTYAYSAYSGMVMTERKTGVVTLIAPGAPDPLPARVVYPRYPDL